MSDTLPEKATSTAVATTESDLPEGLEDLDKSDLVMPRLQINHSEGVFEDNLSGVSYDTIDGILLGLIKQRVLWPPEPTGDGNKPLCKSYNFDIGVPAEGFPVKAAGFTASDVESGELPCASCKLKDWGSHPNRDTPWCSEQHTFALLIPMLEDDPSGAPALLSVQRSGLKPSKQYLTAFARSKQPLYTVRTRITLDQRRRGSVDFAVPKFIRLAATDEALWPEFAQQYRMIRDFVQMPRSFEDEGESDAEVIPTTTTKGEGAPVVTEDDDDLPF